MTARCWCAGAVTITNTTISGNTSEQGGGVSVYNAGPATLTNVTVSHNSTDKEGGGIYNDSSTVQLANTIVGGNNAPEARTATLSATSPRWASI